MKIRLVRRAAGEFEDQRSSGMIEIDSVGICRLLHRLQVIKNLNVSAAAITAGVLEPDLVYLESKTAKNHSGRLTSAGAENVVICGVVSRCAGRGWEGISGACCSLRRRE